MSLNLLQALTGSETIKDLYGSIEQDLLLTLLQTAYDNLVAGEYPKELEEKISFHDRKSKKCYVKQDGEPSDIIYSSFTSAISLKYRVDCNVIGKQSPSEHFARRGNSFIVALRKALIAERGSISDQQLAKELPNYILQYIQDQKLLVNSFPYWRVWSMLSTRISAAIDHIDNGGSLSELVKMCGCFDPTAGWGCRMTSVLLIKAMLLNRAKERGYEKSELDQFANTVFYIGCDTNVDLQPMYRRINEMICREYGLGVASAAVYPFDCINERGLGLADIAISSGIQILMTSPPTPLEYYSDHDGDSMKYAGNYNLNQCNWNQNFLIPFAIELVAKFPASVVFIDGFTFQSNGNKILCDVGSIYGNLLKTYPELFPDSCEIGCCYDESIRSSKCRCFKDRCKQCSGCLKYGLCKNPCNQKVSCESAMIRSGYVVGNLI